MEEFTLSLCAVFTVMVLTKGSTECDFLESSQTGQCFAAVHQPLVFILSNASESHLSLSKDNQYRIAERDQSGKMTFSEEYVEDFESPFNRSGRITLQNARKNYSGEYTLEEHSSTGKRLRTVRVRVQIKDPVSKPDASQRCLTSSQVELRCSSEGDDVHFALTLNNHSLVRTSDKCQCSNSSAGATSEPSKISINIHAWLAGEVVCQAWNEISREETVLHLDACKDVTVLPVTVTCTLSLFPCVLLALTLCLLKKRRSKASTKCNPNPDPEDGVVYTDVQHVSNSSRRGIDPTLM